MAAYPVTPRLMARYGTRAVLAGGLLALGLPALALAVTANIGLILAACVVRGAGFAVLCVAGGALTVSLIPAHRLITRHEPSLSSSIITPCCVSATQRG